MGKVIDVHVHVGTSAAIYSSGGGDIITKLMDDNGIDEAVIFGSAGFEDPEGIESTKVINNMIVDLLKINPTRFRKGLGITPPRQGIKILDEVDRVLGDLKLSGLMFHHDYEGVTIDSHVMYKIVERASKYPDIVIMLHTAQHSMLEPPFMLGKLASQFPKVRFLDAHPMMSLTQMKATIELAKNYPNIYFDTCATYGHEFLLETFVKEVGAERILFGSDMPYYVKLGRAFDKELVENADISDKDKEKIFYDNAKELYNL